MGLMVTFLPLMVTWEPVTAIVMSLSVPVVLMKMLPLLPFFTFSLNVNSRFLSMSTVPSSTGL